MRSSARTVIAAEGFETRAVLNLTDTPPVAIGARVIGAALTIAFDQALDSSGVPSVAAFTIAIDGVTIGVSEVSIGARLGRADAGAGGHGSGRDRGDVHPAGRRRAR